MCGQVRKSTSAAQAVDWSLAFAKFYLDGEEGTPARIRSEAVYFIRNYTPASHREGALSLLAARTDDQLTTSTNYSETIYEE